jgi:hypothetical protein
MVLQGCLVSFHSQGPVLLTSIQARQVTMTQGESESAMVLVLLQKVLINVVHRRHSVTPAGASTRLASG